MKIMDWTLYKPKMDLDEELIKSFEREGKSLHSGSACTLGLVLKHCEDNKIPFKLTALPKAIYQVEIITDESTVKLYKENLEMLED